MIADPPVPPDGTCATCGKPRDPERSRKYARLEADRDPFCSVRCCRSFHGTMIEEQATRVPTVKSQSWARQQYSRGYPLDKVSIPVCGTTTAYKRGCRCDQCRAAARESKRQWRAQVRAQIRGRAA